MKSKHLFYVALAFFAGALIMLGILTCRLAYGQEKPAASAPAAAPKKLHELAQPAPAYEPTEVETLRLKVAQRDAELAQVTVQQANANLQKIVADFNAEVTAIRKAHDWPDTVQIDAQALQRNEIRFLMSAPIPESGAAPGLSKPTGPPVEPAKKP